MCKHDCLFIALFSVLNAVLLGWQFRVWCSLIKAWVVVREEAVVSVTAFCQDSLALTFASNLQSKKSGKLPAPSRPASLHCDGQNGTGCFSANWQLIRCSFKICHDLKSSRDYNSGFTGFCNTQGHGGFISEVFLLYYRLLQIATIKYNCD